MPLAGPPLAAPFDIQRLLETGLSTKPDEIALRSLDACWNWKELAEQSTRLAGHLLSQGLQAGDRVASLMPNRGELIIHYLACMKAGLVATPLNYRYQPPEIDHALKISDASLLLFHAEREQEISKSKLANQLPLGQIRYSGPKSRKPNLEWFLSNDSPIDDFPEIQRDTPAFIYFTSGSTGKPKGVTHTQATIGWMIASHIAALEFTSEDVLLPSSSLSHIGACLSSLSCLACGGRVDVAHLTDGDEVLQLLEQTRPTILIMLPAALTCLVNEHAATKNHFSSLRACFSGGDSVSPALEHAFSKLTGMTIDEVYGMSEIGLATTNRPSGTNKLGSIGQLADGYQASIRNSDQEEVPTGDDGQLWMKSPANTIGYWGHPEAMQKTIQDGWLDTGDLARADSDDYIWFLGRKKRITVHDGSNICPQEIEASLTDHPSIDSACVVGIQDMIHGETVCAYVTLKDGKKQPTVAELIKHSRNQVGYKAPEQIRFLESMPLNTTGKLDRKILKRMATNNPSQSSQ
ncbi:MAG: class I adenylate-forming enzyme family protein [Pirellulaceae bacterium]|nr:class I adenylate-forming enzyme family protein [Pirellulaceae bacterium]